MTVLVEALHELMGVIDTFRTAVVDDAMLSLQKAEAGRLEWLSFVEGLSKQTRSTNAGMYPFFLISFPWYFHENQLLNRSPSVIQMLRSNGS